MFHQLAEFVGMEIETIDIPHTNTIWNMCSAHNYFDHALSADSLQTKKHILIKSVH